ncbi:MAG TPA: HAMP domain-containing sensor histidine kinase [Pyrinomonadaceae bacterium]|nr:HAMP domain-containing sensor histidine kinase [Pyrinomonadaceae bacterium]
MFRDTIRKLSLRKKLTIVASVGVLLPLLVLTYMQYRSLAELQNKTKGAFKDNLRQGLTIVERTMKQRLEEVAAQTLNPIGSISAPEELEKYFADVKGSHKEIEDIFVITYSGDQQRTTQSDVLPLYERARMAQSFVDADRKYTFVDRYLFYRLDGLPNSQSRFAGVLLTERFVKDDLITGTIEKTLGMYHAHDGSPPVAITISDENQRVLYSNAAPQDRYFVESSFDRPFSNWKAQVGLKNTNLDELARNSFLHSAGATVLVLLFLLGGMALTLRATDREARLAQAKSNFVANVSHELKTPLSLISLFSEILELGRVNNEEKKAEYYRIIRHESLRLNKTIDNILDFSRIEAGRKTYQLVHGDIAEVIEHVLSTHRYQIKNSGFNIQTDIQPDLPSVLLDREAMAQAISNLLDNAIKYSGKVKQISITAKMLESDLCIEIADRGVGIPHAEQAKVFEKFYRVGNGLVHDVKGSGLGLSLVKHIIEAHNGTISVESDVGKGTRFTILLPVAPADAQA